MTDLHFRSAKQLASDIRRGKIGCLEAARRVPRAGRSLQPEAQRDRGHRRGRRAPPREAGGRRAQEGQGLGPAARRADDDQGIATTSPGCRRPGGCPRSRTTSRRGTRSRSPSAARGRRRAVRQDQRAARAGRLPELQRRSTAPPTIRGTSTRTPGRLLGRLGRRAGRRPHRHRGGQRHRLLDPQPGALLRRVRPQADLRASCRRAARRCRGRGRPGATSRWSARWRASADDLAIGLDRRWRAPTRSTGRAGASTCRAPQKKTLRDFKVAVMLDRSRRGGRPGGAGAPAGPRRLPRQEEGEGEPRRAARHRHRGGEPGLHLPAARRHRRAGRRPTSSGATRRSRAGSRPTTRATTRG